MKVIKKYKLWHTFKKYAKNVNYEIQIRDRNKIEGAYLLLKRFKDRLRGFDEVMKSIRQEKVDKTDFAILEKSLAKGRAEAVFDDMKRLFDLTVKNFDAKVAHERSFIE